MKASPSTTSIFAQEPKIITEYIQNADFKAYRSQQFCHAFYKKRIFDLEKINIPQDLRALLAKDYDWRLPEISQRLDAEDGASKLLLRSHDGLFFESVILRYPGRTSLCLSSQVGCRRACNFCQTGRLGAFRNLSREEIVAQFALAQKLLHPEDRLISNVVFMGMGEPLDNYTEVMAATKILCGNDAFGLSRRKVTISTAGVVPKIEDLADSDPLALAISLHACRDELRTSLMPINRQYPLAELKKSLLNYQEKTKLKITLEYLLIRDKNCGLREAKELVKFVHGLRTIVNLIPFNPHPGLEYETLDQETIREFQLALQKRGLIAPVRYSKGLEVSAACGQLAAKTEPAIHDKPRRHAVIGR